MRTPPEDSSPEHLAEDLPLDLYTRLRDLARRLMRGEAIGHTLQTTALVHEAYMRLIVGDPSLADEPRRLFAAASDAMRHALIDHARTKRRLKRGGQRDREWMDLADMPSVLSADPAEILALDDAFEALERHDADAAEVVRLRLHLGLGVEDTASLLRISPRTVKRRQAYARSWLFRELSESTDPKQA